MAKKIGLLFVIIIISIILASIYGFLHNQISYSISTEYFTKFKFEQFGFVEYGTDTPRLTAGIIGMWSTWWFGLIIGLILGILAMFQPNSKIMWKSGIVAVLRNLGIAIGIGIIGILIGRLIVANSNLTWDLPANLIDKKNFITVGTMHEFRYAGGIIGLIYGILYQLKLKKASAQQRL